MGNLSRRTTLQLGAGMLVFAHSPISGRVSIALRDWRRKIDEVGSAAIKARTAAGLAIAVVDGKRNTYARGYGLANLETGTPATEHSIFRIASLTKTFTAAALMKLVERGRVDLERRLSTFYGDIPGSENVTLYQLLSHTSGIHDYVSGGLPADALGWKTPDEFADGVRRMTPLFDFDPGTRFSYSNSGYILLGGIIEKTSGRSYAEFLAKEIFQPLGMTRTAVDNLEDVVEGRADGYAIQPGASPFKHAGYGGLPHAAGAMRSCAQDLALWASAFFAGDVVSAQSVRLMTQASRTRSGVKVGEARWWPNGSPPGSPPSFVKDNNYGLGWDLATVHDRPTAGHSGGISGFNAMLMRYLDEDRSLVLLSNTENGIVAPWLQLIEWAGRTS